MWVLFESDLYFAYFHIILSQVSKISAFYSPIAVISFLDNVQSNWYAQTAQFSVQSSSRLNIIVILIVIALDIEFQKKKEKKHMVKKIVVRSANCHENVHASIDSIE